MITQHQTYRIAALAILSSDTPLSRKAGSFLGQVAVDPTPLSVAQREWLDKLAARAGMQDLVSEVQS